MKEDKTLDPLNVYTLLILSVATSIDALAVGLSLSALNVAIIAPAVLIGIITFLFSFAGVYIGKRVGHLFESKIELAGGLILIGIGIKILTEHLA
ncbi:MAG: putative rane protein [Deltaproteobacteria bacterium]|nr:putative rane protein [Deltaproteobacteria bacterium]